MISVLDPAVAASPLSRDKDAEMIREALSSFSQHFKTIVASLETTQPPAVPRRSHTSYLPALVATHRQLLRLAEEAGALSPPEAAQARSEFAEAALAACQKQADAVFARCHSPDCRPAELCALVRMWATLSQMSEGLPCDENRV